MLKDKEYLEELVKEIADNWCRVMKANEKTIIKTLNDLVKHD